MKQSRIILITHLFKYLSVLQTKVYLAGENVIQVLRNALSIKEELRMCHDEYITGVLRPTVYFRHEGWFMLTGEMDDHFNEAPLIHDRMALVARWASEMCTASLPWVDCPGCYYCAYYCEKCFNFHNNSDLGSSSPEW